MLEKRVNLEKLKVLYAKVDGVLSKNTELKDFIVRNKPKIICLTETKLTSEINTQFLDWTDYNI